MPRHESKLPGWALRFYSNQFLTRKLSPYAFVATTCFSQTSLWHRPTSEAIQGLLKSKVGGLLMILAPASAVASQLMVTDMRPQLVMDSIRVVQAWSSTALGSLSFGPAKPRLIVEQSRATKGEPAPLGLTLEGPGGGAVVHIAGLAQGMELSAGSAVGDGWEVPANHLGDAWIAPPEGFSGSVDLVAELRGPNDNARMDLPDRIRSRDATAHGKSYPGIDFIEARSAPR